MNKFIFITLISVLFTWNVQAQEIEPEVFVNTKDTRKIELPVANRNFEKINFELKQAPAKPQEYVSEDVEIKVANLTTKINVVTMKPQPIEKLYGNYVKAGFGNYATPYFEGFFNNKRSTNLSYGAHLKHFSSQNGPVKFSGLSQNKVDGYVNYFTKTFQFNSGISFNRDRYNFYGFNQALPVEKDTLKQIFNTFSLRAGIKSLNKDSKLFYDADFVYYNFRDRYRAKEDEYLTSFSGEYKLDSEKIIKTDAVLSISKRRDSMAISRNYFLIKPALFYDLGKYKITAGINAAYTTDTINTSKFHLYPRLNVDASLIDNRLTAFAGMEGVMEKNTLRTFVGQNAYLEDNVLLLHSNRALELYGGLKGNYSGINFKGKLAYINYKNLYFFNNSLRDSSQFTILYDRGNTTVINIEGDVSYEVAETFRLGVNMNYFSYNTGNLEKPWHRPNFTTSLLASYNLRKKIYINTDIYYISGLSGKNYISGREVKLDGILDVNLKVDYKFSNVFSAFLEVNNILSKKYQRYLYYPVKGINVIGGISYSF